jgi:DNA replication licensing factor MCM4
MRELNPDNINSLIAIKGIVTRVSSIIPDMRTGFFKCKVCDHTLVIENIRGRIEQPQKCPREGCKSSWTLSLVHNRCTFSDKQIIRLQETPDAIPDGQTPHTVSLIVYDSLVDKVRPGDRVQVTGIYRSSPVRLNSRMNTRKTIYRTYVDLVHIRKQIESRLKPKKDEMNADDYVTAFDDEKVAEDVQRNLEHLKTIAEIPDLYEKLSGLLAPR